MSAPLRIGKPPRAGFESRGVQRGPQGDAAVAAPAGAAPPAAGEAGEAAKEYLQRLVLLIPSEAVGLYLVGRGLFSSSAALAAVWIAVGLAAVFVVRIYGTRDQQARVPTQWGAVWVAAGAYVIWIYSMGGVPFDTWNLHNPSLASMLVLAYTFFVPYFYRG